MARPREFDLLPALDGAVAAFRSHSYAGTSTAQLCTATGLSRSSLYNTFVSKADLYRRCLERYDAQMTAERSGYLTADGDGRHLLRSLLTQVVTEQADTEDRRGCLVINAAVEVGLAEPEVAAFARNNLDAFRALLTQLIARGQDDGSIRDDRPAADLAAVVHSTLNGLQVAGRVADSPEPCLATVDTLLSLL